MVLSGVTMVNCTPKTICPERCTCKAVGNPAASSPGIDSTGSDGTILFNFY